MQLALAASIGVAEWMTKENVLWLPYFCNFRQRNHPHVSAPHHALFLPVSTNVFYLYTNFISSTPLLRIFFSWSNTSAWSKHSTTILGEPSLANPRGMYYNGKEGRKEPLLITSYNTGRACHISISSASRRARHKSYAL